MAVSMNTVVSDAIEFGPRIVSLVKSIKTLFGHGKTGAEKKDILVSDIQEGVDLGEGISGKDFVDNTKLQALLSESIDVAHQITTLEDQLKSIAAQIKALKPAENSSAPGPDGVPA